MEEKDFWIGFSVFPGVGPMTFQKLLTAFGSAKGAWNASERNLQENLGEKKTQAFLVFRETFSIVDYKNKLKKAKITIITSQDAVYPQRLKKIKNAPFVLFTKGNSSLLSYAASIAIVGTRKITQYGSDVTKLFTQELVTAGCMVVSGLAMGVDARAHTTTIENQGKTVAVLGCGVDCCYPRENQHIYDAILDSGGLIISEIPLGQPGGIGTFPARNRIVAALSDGILVTEGAQDSGALITAQFGLTYGKKVFAVPGPITSSLSKGPYKLIEQGAKLVTKPEDILQELKMTNYELGNEKKKKMSGDTKEEQMVIDLLTNEPMSFDELVRALKIDSAALASLVSLLEIKGIIASGKEGKLVVSFS